MKAISNNDRYSYTPRDKSYGGPTVDRPHPLGGSHFAGTSARSRGRARLPRHRLCPLLRSRQRRGRPCTELARSAAPAERFSCRGGRIDRDAAAGAQRDARDSQAVRHHGGLGGRRGGRPGGFHDRIHGAQGHGAQPVWPRRLGEPRGARRAPERRWRIRQRAGLHEQPARYGVCAPRVEGRGLVRRECRFQGTGISHRRAGAIERPAVGLGDDRRRRRLHRGRARARHLRRPVLEGGLRHRFAQRRRHGGRRDQHGSGAPSGIDHHRGAAGCGARTAARDNRSPALPSR